MFLLFFFFQAEDGIRDYDVTGVQTCALPISYGIQDDPRYFQITTPIQPGNSGGVVFTDNGEAVGIIVSSINDEMIMNATGTIAQNINFALKFDYVEVLLKSENLETEYSKANYKNLLLEDLVDLIEPITCQIIVKRELTS